MKIWATRLTAILVGLSMLLTAVPGARAAAPAPPPPPLCTPGSDGAGDSIGRTPPRLSYLNGDVSFWRPGAPDWGAAQVNTPLAPGDELYTSDHGNLELQIGGRAFVRAWTDTQLGLVNQEPDFVQLKVTSGHISLDLRSVDPGHTVEVDTPQAAFTIEAPRLLPGGRHGRAHVVHHAALGPRHDDARRRPGGVHRPERRGRPGRRRRAGRPELRRPAARRLGQLELRPHRSAARLHELSLRRLDGLRRGRSRPLRQLARRAELRLRVGAGRGADRLGAVQHGPLGRRSVLRLDVGRHGAVGLGAVPPRSLGLRGQLLGVGAGSDRRPARVLTGARRVLRPSRCAGRGRQPVRQLGGAGLGRADRSVVGLAALHRPSPTGPAGAGRASSTTSSSTVRPWST